MCLILSCWFALMPLIWCYDTNYVVFNYYKLLVYYLNNNVVNLYIIIFFFSIVVRLNKVSLIAISVSTLAYHKSSENISNLLFLHSLSFGWVLIHPFFFYSSLIFIILLFSSLAIYRVKISYRFLSFLLVAALFLGSFWGWAVTVWGFYWLYDMVELVLFILILVVTISTHCRYYLVRYNMYVFFLIILGLFTIRYGVFNTRHAFFSKSTHHYIPYIFIVLLVQSLSFRLIKLHTYYSVNMPSFTVILLYPLLVNCGVAYYICFFLIYFLFFSIYLVTGWRITIQILHTFILYGGMFLLIFTVNYTYTINNSTFIKYWVTSVYNFSYSLDTWFNNFVLSFKNIKYQVIKIDEVYLAGATRRYNNNILFSYSINSDKLIRTTYLNYNLYTNVYFHDLKVGFSLVDFD